MISRWLVAGSLALAACTNARQIVLSIDTTVGVPCDIDRIRIVAKAAGNTTIDQPLKGARLPISVTLLDDTPSGNFTVDISGFKGNVEVMRATGPLRFTGGKATDKVLLEPKCRPTSPCELSEALAAGAAPPGGARSQCGANVTRYRAEPAVETFVDACTASATLSGKVTFDGSGRPVRLMDLESLLSSSKFEFYGRPVRQVWVSKDGYISFAQDSPDPTGVLVPGPLDRDIKHIGEPPPPQSVMAFWDTVTLSPNGVCYELDGPSGAQRLRVTWSHACLTQPCLLADDRNNLNFTIRLDESNQDESNQKVVVTYGTMNAGNMDRQRGATATVGLADHATGCPVEECSATGLCKDGVTPCGYLQVFSNTVQPSGISNMQFTPIVDP